MKRNLLYFAVLVSLMGLSVAFNAGPDLAALSTPVPPPKRPSLLSTQEIKDIDSVEIDYVFRGKCYAQSSLLNSRPSNGEAHFGILPQKVDTTFSQSGLYLVINGSEYVEIGENKLGCKLYLVNTSDTIKNFRVSDSRLYIVAEVLNENNVWVPISYLPSSGCGNSIHMISLDVNEFWEFDVPIFKGDFKTKLRYTLTREKQVYYSNEVIAFINRKQFDPERKEGHSKKNLMDPYDD